MATAANSMALAAQARRSYVGGLLNGLPSVVHAVDSGARILLSQVADPATMMRRRDVVEALSKAQGVWLQGAISALRAALLGGGLSVVRPADLPPMAQRTGAFASSAGLSLVDNDTIESEILSSRLALAMMDRASWEFTDMRSRVTMLEGREELDANDVLRPHVLARIVTNGWRTAGLTHEAWRTLQTVLHDEFAHFGEEAYHETNRWLIQQGVLPEIDLRPFIRRTRNSAWSSSGTGGGSGAGFSHSGSSPGPTDHSRAEVHDETRLMTRAGGLARGADHAEAVLGRLNRLIGRQLPEFANTQQARPASQALRAAITDAQQGIARRLASTGEFAGGPGQASHVSTPMLLEELHQRKQQLKQAASTPVERATIEIVALLFQSILMEERIPAAVRVWFARLQMPVLRVAVSEPDFFATIDHPARRLIDRMGACVMGFDATMRAAGDLVEKEIKRVVQVVEAYPDTGRRVFQTVLTEFEKFLEHYFKNENEASRKGVSLAQQVEQRETLAIQYTI
jgi:hypothetical protein